MHRMLLSGCAFEQSAQRTHGGLRVGEFSLEVIDVGGDQDVALGWAACDEDGADVGDWHAQIA